MKIFYQLALILAIMFVAMDVLYARNLVTVTGIVTADDGTPVEFCNVVLNPTDVSANQRGVITSSDGSFSISADAGSYTFIVMMLGYEKQERPITLSGNIDMGTIVLKTAAVEVGEVVVKGEMIRRKADGYTVAIGQAPVAIGRNSLEVLSFVPGVWFDKTRGISINGKTGTQVMVNERLLNLSGDDLSDYLANIKAEDIKSVEVIPNTGAKYDASATGGILKITLKKQANQGMNGSIAYNHIQSDMPMSIRPSFDLNYRKNKLSLYTGFNFNFGKYREKIHETTDYHDGSGMNIENNTLFNAINKSYYAKFGSVYEFSDNQSVGVDLEYLGFGSDGRTRGMSDITEPGMLIKGGSGIHQVQKGDRYTVSANYMLKFDSLGSSLIVAADYVNNVAPSSNYTDFVNTIMPDGEPEYIYERDLTDRKNQLYTLRADFNYYIGKKWQIEAGAKYSYNNMLTDLRYDNKSGETWVPNPELSDNFKYREGVIAGYVNGQAELGKWNLMAGLRLENTSLRPYSYTRPEDNVNQNYTDLFPSAMVNYNINKDKGYSISATYGRKISRPGFNSLNPFRIALNEYTYIVGNPDLKPSYTDALNMTTILAGKYTLSVSYDNSVGVIDQVVIEDPNNQGVLLYKNMNMDRVRDYKISASIPINITKWWRLGIDATTGYSENKVNGTSKNKWVSQGRANNLFTLPNKWYIEFNGFYTTSFYNGNMLIGELYSFDGSVRKSFLNNKLTASVSITDMFDTQRKMKMKVDEPGKFTKTLHDVTPWRSRYFGLSLRYNFSVGKDVKVNRVKSRNDEDRSRL